MLQNEEINCGHRESCTSSDQPKAYKYTPIRNTNNRTRVFALDPGSSEEPLQGCLSTMLIDNCEAYEALSYAWGAPEKRHRVLLDGDCYLSITESLSAALYRLRDTRIQRRLWIDALCIDQENLQEKAEQVELMGHIYKCSTGVLCWLGEDNTRRDGMRAIKLLNRIGRTKLAGINIGLNVLQIEQIPGLPPRTAKVWKSLYHLFNIPWFMRCWVVQEFALAPEATLICGDFSVASRAIGFGVMKVTMNALLNWLAPYTVSAEKQQAVHAAYVFMNMVGARCRHYMDEFWYMTFQSLQSGDKTIGQLQAESIVDQRLANMLQEINHFGQNMPPSTVVALMDQSINMICSGHFKRLGRWTNIEHLSLTTLVSMMRVAEATDARDKVFSMLALANESHNAALRPSYTEDFNKVFARVARHLIANGGQHDGLVILEQAQLDPGPGHLTGELPTWAPDWTQKCVETCTLTQTAFSGGNRIYAAATKVARRVRLPDDPNMICITGGRVGRVANLVHWPKIKKNRSYDRNDPENFYLGEDGKFLSFDSLLRALEDLRGVPEYGGGNVDYNLVEYFRRVDAMICNREPPYVKAKLGESNKTVQIQTLTAGLENLTEALTTGVAQPRYTALYDDFRKRLDDFAQHMEELRAAGQGVDVAWGEIYSQNSFAQRWLTLAEFYSVCESTEGVVGLVPRATQPDDELWVLLGGAMPFVVRRANDYEDQYSLIGACYLHGLMAGEALMDSSWSEQEICLI